MATNDDQPTLFDKFDDDPKKNVRRDDPDTSRQAAYANPTYRKGQKWALLKAHVQAFLEDPDYGGMTADEAWTAAGFSVFTRTCYWHRHGDLENHHGHLRTVIDERTREPLTRPGISGEQQMVRKLTREGLAYYRKVIAEGGEQ